MSDLERTISMFRQQQPQSQPQVPQVPQLPITQPPAMPGGVNFQQLMSVMQQFQQGTGFPQQQPVQSQPQMQPNLGAMFSQFAGQNQQAGPSTQSYDDPERKRVRDSGQYDDPYDNQWSRGKRTKANDSKPVSPDNSLCFAQFKEMLIWITVQGRTRSLPVLEGGQVPEGRQLHLQTRPLNSFRRYQPDPHLVLQ
jgi:hypothetical protein